MEVYGGGVWWRCIVEVYGGGVWWRCMVDVYGGGVWWNVDFTKQIEAFSPKTFKNIGFLKKFGVQGEKS